MDRAHPTRTGASFRHEAEIVMGVVQSFDVVLHITAASFADADETYAIEVQTTDAAGANPVTHDTINVTADMVGKTIEVTIHPDSLAKMDADAAKLRLNANVGGTTPSLTYWAFASQLTR